MAEPTFQVNNGIKAVFESRVRFSEADHTELLTLPGLVNYFQDCSTFQSEDIGYGVESLKKKRAGMDSFRMADCSKPLSETRGTYPGVHLGNGFYRTFRTS